MSVDWLGLQKNPELNLIAARLSKRENRVDMYKQVRKGLTHLHGAIAIPQEG